MSKYPDHPPVLRLIFRIGLLLLIVMLAACGPSAAPEKQPVVSTLRVVMDENYPPYVFRGDGGKLQGILIDQWILWEERTGVKVEITALPWGEALERMMAGEFDVIDTIFYTADRARILDFTDPYAQINVRIFFHNNISGIANANDLKGLRVAVKKGDANAEYLLQRGVTDLTYYGSYEEIILAAKRKEETIFVIDQPPALYFLYKNGLQDQFNYSESLYGGEFHRAVKKGNDQILALVVRGFSQITKAEYQAVDTRWFGSGQGNSLQQIMPFLALGAAIAALIILVLITFNRMLRSRVQTQTLELREALSNLQQSETRFREAIEFFPVPVSISNSQGRILSVNRKFADEYGYTLEDIPYVTEWMLRAYPAPAYRHEVQTQWDKDVAEAVKRGTSTNLREYKVTCKDGSQRVVELVMHPIGHLWVASFNNITERKQVGDALRENRRFLADLIEYSGALIFVKDREGRYELINRKWEEVTGLKREVVIGKTDEVLFPGLNGKQFRANDLEVIETGSVIEKEEILDGEAKRHFISIKFPVHDENSNVKGICGMTTEITERKQAEAALQESETIFSSFLEHSPVYVFFKDKDIRALRLSENYEQMLGMPISEALGKTMDELFPSDLAKSMVADDLQILNEGQRVDVVEELNGRIYETTKFPIFKDGKPFMLAGFTVDITERKQAEAALRESEAIFSSFLAHSPIYIFFMDKNIRTLRLSKNYEQMLGMPISEMLGKTMDELYSSDSVKNMVADDLQVLNSGQQFDIVEEINGRIYQTTKFPVLKDGKPDMLIGIAVDITDRKHAEQALQESEENYRILVELAPDGIIVHRDGKVVFANSAAVRLIRAKNVDEILGLPAINFVHPDMRTMIAARIKEMQEVGAKVAPLEEKFICMDGTVIDVEVVAMPVHYESRPAIQVVVRDISERKQMVDSLKASEEKYRTLIETVNVGIFMSTLDGKFLQANSAVVEMAGYANLEEFMQTPVQNLYANFAARESIKAELQNQSSVKNIEVLSVKKDGAQYWISLSAVLMKDTQGKPTSILGSVTDITERKRSADVIQQSEKRFKTLIENSADALTLLDAEGNVIYEGPTVKRITGFSAESRVGRSALENIHPADLPLVRDTFSRVLTAPGDSISAQFRSIRQDGSIWWTEATATNLLQDPSVQAIVVNYRDITIRKQAEENLRESEERFRQIVEASPMGIHMYQLQGDRLVFTGANPAADRILRVDNSQFIGKTIENAFPPLAETEVPDRYRQAASEGIPWEMVQVDYDYDGIRGAYETHAFQTGLGRMAVMFLDITERKKAQADLEKSEKRNRAIVAALPDLLFEISTEGRFLDCIASDPRRLLVPREQAIGQRLDEFLPLELATMTMERIQQTLSDGAMQVYEYSLKFQDVERYYESRMTPLGPDSVLALVREITESKQIEQALRQSEQRYRTLFELANDAIFVETQTDQILDVNQHACQMLGYTREELIKMRVVDLIAPEIHRGGPAIRREISEYGRKPFESLDVRKDGVRIPVEVTNSILPDGLALSIVRDITERKRAEEELRNSENRFRILFEQSGVGVAQMDSITGRFIQVNQRYCEILGYMYEELEQMNFQTITHPDDLQQDLDNMERLRVGQISEFTMEKRFYRKNGTLVWVILIVSPLWSPGEKPDTHIAVVHDITDQKRTEFALRYSEAEVRKLNAELERRVAERTAQLETTNKELEAFSYSVSHDLRAPLRAIDGFSRMVLEDHASQLDEEVRKLLGHVHVESQRMAQLIEALLNLSRVGRVEMRREIVNLSSLAQQILDGLRETEPQRQVECVIESDLTAQGDTRLLSVVLENLLGNAWKFTSKREQARIEFGVEQRENAAVYFMRDNGAGFDMAYAEKLFGAFQRLHGQHEFEGTGIGLATVQRIVSRHGGRVWAEGEVGKGATFYFTLG